MSESQKGTAAKRPITYKEKLNRQFRQYVVRLLVLACVFMVLLILLYSVGLNTYRNSKNSKKLLETVEKGYDSYAEFIQEETCGVFLKRLRGEISNGFTDYYCNSFDLTTDYSADWVLTDENNSVIYSNVHDGELGIYMQLFTELAHKNAKELRLYHSAYSFGGKSCYVMTCPIFSDGKRLGTISCYINGTAIEQLMHQKQFDGVVSGYMGRTIAVSNPAVLMDRYRFQPPAGRFYTVNGQTYDVRTVSSARYELSVTTLLRISDSLLSYNMAILFLVAVLLTALILAGMRFSNRVAELNAHSLETLLAQINTIGDGSGENRIRIETGDEFEDVADHINQMLDRQQSLSERNMELGRLNNQMERLRLEAQFDPHFLYNTLESIRYGIRLGDKNIDGIILKLTSLLRYSIGNHPDTVTLAEDLRRLQDYLDIICYRFGDRLQYNISISDNCMSHPCPKLCLQPIVENSIKYNFSHKKQLNLQLTGWEEKGCLFLQVSDDGVGMDPELVREMQELLEAPADTHSLHHGLRNIDRRLKLQFAGESGIRLTSQVGKGTTVLLCIGPKEETE